VLAPVLAAGPAAAETTMQVDAGYAGSFVPGQDVPVRVRISADRLVRGTLEVAVGGLENGAPVAMAVEVPGGSEKQFVVTARAGPDPAPDVVARLRQDDTVLASGQASVRAAGDTELVGLLPGAVRGRAIPGVTPLAVDAGTARFSALGEAELEEAPASLGPLSTLAADPGEIVRLSPAARAGVLRWLEAGGRLLVDGMKGEAVPGIPDAWQPGTRGRAPAGLGEVVATEGAIAAGRWAGLVEPSGRGLHVSRMGGQAALASSLASDAGLRTPEVRWLAGFLILYVLAVGPLLFFAVRRSGRPELAWVAVPLVAVLFSTGSYVVGRDLRKATRLVHGSVLMSGVGGPVATSYVGVVSRGGERTRIGFPAGWSSGSSTEIGSPAASPSLVTRTPDGPDARLPLDPGQFGMVVGKGPVTEAGGLEITTATIEGGDRVTGSVRNPSPFPLEDVAVFAGTDVTLVGALGPGETQPFSVTWARPERVGDELAFKIWAGMRPVSSTPPADFGLWQAALASAGSALMEPGAVVAAGWTDDFVPDVRVKGRTATPQGRTVVIGRRQVDPGSAGRLELTARREVVRDGFANRRGLPGFPGSVVRFVLPGGADTTKLVLRSPFGGAELWQDGAWRPAVCRGPACGPGQGVLDLRGDVGIACPPGAPCPGPRPEMVPARPFPLATEFTVPPESVRDGVIYVRVDGSASLEQGVSIGRSV
jgi:hypothetical protein